MLDGVSGQCSDQPTEGPWDCRILPMAVRGIRRARDGPGRASAPEVGSGDVTDDRVNEVPGEGCIDDLEPECGTAFVDGWLRIGRWAGRPNRRREATGRARCS